MCRDLLSWGKPSVQKTFIDITTITATPTFRTLRSRTSEDEGGSAGGRRRRRCRNQSPARQTADRSRIDDLSVPVERPADVKRLQAINRISYCEIGDDGDYQRSGLRSKQRHQLRRHFSPHPSAMAAVTNLPGSSDAACKR